MINKRGLAFLLTGAKMRLLPFMAGIALWLES